MDNVVYKGKLRKDVIDTDGKPTPEFSEFIKRCQGKVGIEDKEFGSSVFIPFSVSFECEEDLVAYTLTFDEVDPFKVIIPRIRKVMPSAIANDIIGVQPMVGPINQIYKLRQRYGFT